MFRTTENGLLLTMPPSRNDVISGSTLARICSLKLAAINFCRSGQSNPRFASNLSRFESWTGGNAPGKLDVARAASARTSTSARPEVSLSSGQLRYLKVQNSLCSRSAITDGVLIFTLRGYPKKSVIETARSSSWPGGRRDDGLSPWPRMALSPSNSNSRNLSPSKGGSNQRERKNIDRFFWISRSTAGPRRRKRNNIQRTGRRNHLLHGRARCDEPSKRRTSASSSHKSRRWSMERSC